MKEIRIAVNPAENFTASGLMHRYAKQTPGAKMVSRYFETYLSIYGIEYRYHHWSITAENGVDIVTLYLVKV